MPCPRVPPRLTRDPSRSMCGIAGFVRPAGGRDTDDATATLGRMSATLRHRGPDDSGVWTDGTAGLAHQRLAIIDLSPAGHQPMASEDGRVHIVFNGEIYNFLELRRELEEQGFAFRSRSDTEVIVQGYRRWGADVFSRLRGMFAIAIWDTAERRLILARDRVGKKPLYYALHDGCLVFGSEIKAILAFPGIPRRPNLEAIHHYLTLQYVPSPWTAFEGIHKLPPAHTLVLEARGEPKLAAYWSLPDPRSTRPRPRAELIAELVEQLREAVRLRLISDVPLGAFLSGGVDSSAVVAMMAQAGVGRVKTFSIGFREAEYDETRWARRVAERYGTEHEEMIVEPDAVDVVPKLVWHYGEPFADSSAVPTYYVSQMARRHVTVALNGDGGDESFLGYPRYERCWKRDRSGPPSVPLRRLAGALVHLVPPFTARIPVVRIVRRVLKTWTATPVELYAPSIVYFRDEDKLTSYGDSLRPLLDRSTLALLDPYFAAAPSLTGGASWADLHTYLPDDLLVKVDVASMAHSLEARSPLLDHALMEWAATIPVADKLAGGLKSLLKEAMEPHLPHDLLHRPKMGFGVPIDHWFRRELEPMARDVLLDATARRRGLFRPRWVEATIDQHVSGRYSHHIRLWAMLMLELWFRMWIDSNPPEARPA
ncbi:MAG: asparagine synthase (glutamine-hydrolyzing) [bacterium]